MATLVPRGGADRRRSGLPGHDGCVCRRAATSFFAADRQLPSHQAHACRCAGQDIEMGRSAHSPWAVELVRATPRTSLNLQRWQRIWCNEAYPLRQRRGHPSCTVASGSPGSTTLICTSVEHAPTRLILGTTFVLAGTTCPNAQLDGPLARSGGPILQDEVPDSALRRSGLRTERSGVAFLRSAEPASNPHQEC